MSTVEWEENSEMVSDYSLFNEYKKQKKKKKSYSNFNFMVEALLGF